MYIPSFIEDKISQILALQFLRKLGYTYFTRAEAEKSIMQVLLTGPKRLKVES